MGSELSDPDRMKRLLYFLVASAVVGLAAKRACSVAHIDWEQKINAMPDNSPPKWMFRSITAIRDNTDRILELLQREPNRSAPPVMATG
jgi:hypothetical protein